MTSFKKFRIQCRGFTLIELLVVLAMAGSLVALSMVGYTAIARGAAVTSGADMLSDALSEGRQFAVTQNQTVEVRIYELAAQPNSGPAYAAMQLHWLKADGTTPPVASPILLPAWVVIDATSAHSSLIGANTQTATPDAGDTRLNSQTRVFHFLPDGSTDLDPAGSWFLTVRPATQSDPAHFPSNWASVKVDPVSGHVQIYRP